MSTTPTQPPAEYQRCADIARFMVRSAERLGRLAEIAAPKIVIARELQIIKARIADFEIAMPWTPEELAELKRSLE